MCAPTDAQIEAAAHAFVNIGAREFGDYKWDDLNEASRDMWRSDAREVIEAALKAGS